MTIRSQINDLAGKAVSVDTNLIVALCGGDMPGIKSRAAFDRQDLDILRDLLTPARRLIVNQFIIAECSNLLGKSESRKPTRLAWLKRYVGRSDEGTVSCDEATSHPWYIRLGATDAAILAYLAANPDVTLLTVDVGLYNAALAEGLDVVNFNHVRERLLGWG